MKAYRTKTKDGKIESYYLICHNNSDQYQLVSIPWKRIDYRVYNSEKEAINDLAHIIFKNRESIVEECELSFTIK